MSLPVPDPSVEPDLWTVATTVETEAETARAAHPDLVRQLAEQGTAFGRPGRTTADLLDELGRRSVIDVDAPVTSSRPVVPQAKRVVRKANAFLLRHLAQQTTVLAAGLTEVARQLDDRVQLLETGRDGEEAAARLADHRPAHETALATLPGPVRHVTTWAEARSLPAGTSTSIVLARLGDVLAAPERGELLDHLARALAPGGRLAIVTTAPAAWDGVDPIARDLAPGRPVHADTWTLLLQQLGGRIETAVESGPSLLVIARW